CRPTASGAFGSSSAKRLTSGFAPAGPRGATTPEGARNDLHATPRLPDAKELPMLKTVRDACTPHKMALDFSMAEQIEDLAAVIGGAGDGQAFFAKNHITAGMRQLFDLGLRRLAGRSDQAVFELTQAMGGGKTHTMIAFGLVARNAKLRES